MKLKQTLYLSLILLATSCGTPKNITYFQDLTNGESVQPQSVYDIRVRPDDKLLILVSTQDPALTALFNLVQVQNRIAANSTVGSNIYNTDARTAYYTVDNDGDINFTVLGKIHIGGMKRAEVAEYIEKKLI